MSSERLLPKEAEISFVKKVKKTITIKLDPDDVKAVEQIAKTFSPNMPAFILISHEMAKEH